jgi:Tropinone reductase 1
VLFGSTTGTEPSDKKMAYGVSKAAVHNLTLSAALEGSEYGIITNTIAPSYVMTPRHEAEIEKKAEKKGVTKEEIRAALASKNPLRRILDTEDLIPVVELLLTTSSMQGQVVRVDLGQVGI